MNKKTVKQKRRMFIGISLSLFAVSMVVFAVFAVTTYYSELDLLTSRAYLNSQSLALNMMYCDGEAWGYYLLNQKYDEEFSDKVKDGNTQIVISENDTGHIFCQTEDAVSVEFYDKDNFSYFGCIEYNRFKDSLTDEQYKEISDYLTKKTAENGEYYELLCTQFYTDGSHIQPKSVEIVQTCEDNAWYVQDKTVKRYELKPVLKNKEAELYDCAEMHRNVIADDFVFGNYRQNNVFAEYSRAIQENSDIYENQSLSYDEDLYYNINRVRVAPFTYIYHNIEQLTITPYNSDEPKNFSCSYAQKFNVLESCADKLIFMLIFTLVVFVIAGIIIGAVTWRTLKKQLEQENRLRTVTNAMAHELKTPLFVIGGFSESLAENINTEKRQHYAEVITEKTHSMNELVSKMLDYSKLDSQGFIPNFEKFSLSDMTREIIDHFITAEIVFYCADDVIINADKKLIYCAVENLIDNAVKYSVDNRAITVRLNDSTFAVSNPCKPVTKAEISDMWQPYRRSAEHSEIQGHGLGLSIVKSIMEIHGFGYSAKYDDNNLTFRFNFR